MNLKEFYTKIGGSYDAVLSRLGSENMIRRFVLKFAGDPTFESLTHGFSEGDPETAFRAAHTLKGVCSNLGFDRLLNVASELTEDLRPKSFTDRSESLLAEVKTEYDALIAAIGELK